MDDTNNKILQTSADYLKNITSTPHSRTGPFKYAVQKCNKNLINACTSAAGEESIVIETKGSIHVSERDQKVLPLVSERIKLKNEIQKLITKNKSAKVSIETKRRLIEASKKEIKSIEEELRNPGGKILRSVFSEAQINLLRGNLKKVYWHDDDLAQAFTLRHMGGKELYLYLKNTLNYPLPSLSCIQTWAANKYLEFIQKREYVSSVFPSQSRQSRNQSTTRITKVDKKSVNSPPKKLKFTNPFELNTRPTDDKGINEILSQKYNIQNINIMSNEDDSSNDSHMFTPSKMQTTSNLSSRNRRLAPKSTPESSIETKIFTASNQPRSFPQKRPIQRRFVHMEKTKSLYPILSQEITSKATKGKQLQNKTLETEMAVTVDTLEPTSKQPEIDFDIKEEILDIKTDNGSDVEPAGDSSNNSVYLGVEDLNRIEILDMENLKIIKQSLEEEHERLEKEERVVDRELKQLAKKIKNQKALSQQLPDLEMELLKKCFSTAQIRLLCGQRKSRWSLDDLAVAYRISSLSSRDFYMYLRTTLKYPLPAISNISRCFKSKYRTTNKGNKQE